KPEHQDEDEVESDRTSYRRLPAKKKKQKTYEELSCELGFGAATGFFETNEFGNKENTNKTRDSKWQKRSQPQNFTLMKIQ
ncbi:hypothetical protein M1146_06330, partial [Patescibacteria group bacterium]|nr:hypothetical protein [Patescibacteria group bacterium]